MHYRRIVCLLLGLWLGGGIAMALFGARSFQTVDRVVNQGNPSFAVQTRPLGRDATRIVLHYEIAEANRFLFQEWEYVQLILGSLFFAYLLFGTLEGKVTLALALVMLVLTSIQRFGISNELGSVGRSLVYVPAEIVRAEQAKFWLLHSAYVGIEALKFGVAIVIIALALRGGRSVDPVNKFNMVDKRNHRHVNW